MVTMLFVFQECAALDMAGVVLVLLTVEPGVNLVLEDVTKLPLINKNIIRSVFTDLYIPQRNKNNDVSQFHTKSCFYHPLKILKVNVNFFGLITYWKETQRNPRVICGT